MVLALGLPHGLPAQGPLLQRPVLQPAGAGLPEGRAGLAFLASAMLPGAGQYYLGEERWVPYLALEAWAWISYARQQSRGRTLERRYRNLAWQVARRICPGVRRDTAFAYYEAMAQYHDSGAFDSNNQVAGTQPELRAQTYNGQQWLRAQALFLPFSSSPGTPEYQRALSYYEQNAIPPGYCWSWGDSNLEQEYFNRLIDDSDDALRTATRTLGLILANHVVSAIDALITARLRTAATGDLDINLRSELEPVGGAIQWKTTVRFPLGH
jgi:hypothetical protein